MDTEDILKSLERTIDQGLSMLEDVESITRHIDNELVERRGGQVVRDLWTTTMDYRERVLEGRAAA